MSDDAYATASPDTHRPVLKVLRSAPRAVWVLIIGVFVNRVGSYFSTFVVLFLTAKGFAVAALPGVLVAIGISGMAGSLVGGWLADVVGRKRSLVTSMVASALGLAALSVVTSHVAVVVAVCVVALCTASYLPAAAALLVDYTAPEDRVPIFAFFRVALNLGAAVGPLAAGLIATTSYGALFVVDAATCLAFAVLLLAGLPSPAKPSPATSDGGTVPEEGGIPSAAPSSSRAAGRVPVLVLCMGVLCVAMAYAQHSSTLPLQLADRGFSPGLYGLVLAANGLLVILCELPLSSLTRRYPWNVPMLAGALLITFGMALSGLVAAPVAVLAAVGVWSFGEMLLTPVASSAVAALSPPDRIGRYQALLSTTQGLGFSLGPAIGILAFSRGEQLPWLGCALVGVAAVALIELARRRAAAGPEPSEGQVSRRPPAGSVEEAALDEAPALIG